MTKITLIMTALPPQINGIGDYTASIAHELTRRGGFDVRILTAHAETPPTPIPGVEIEALFSPADPRSVENLVAPIVADRPDWVVLQYNPFLYGKWGWNPYLPGVLRAIKRGSPQTRIAVMAHETFVPAESPQFMVMTTWQRGQYWQLGQACDLMFLSVEPWATRFARWFPRIPVRHLPIGSSIPLTPLTQAGARQALQIAPDAFVLGFFGTAHPSRMIGLVADAARRLREQEPRTLLLYVGPDGAAMRSGVGDGAEGLLRDDGPLPAEGVSHHFHAMDVCLSPYLDGVSTRRSAFMPALQHEIATVGTSGIHTDTILHTHDSAAFFLPPVADTAKFHEAVELLWHDPTRRATMARSGRELYEAAFDWTPICEKMLAAFYEVTGGQVNAKRV